MAEQVDQQFILSLICQQLQHYGFTSVSQAVASSCQVIDFSIDPSDRLAQLITRALSTEGEPGQHDQPHDSELLVDVIPAVKPEPGSAEIKREGNRHASLDEFSPSEHACFRFPESVPTDDQPYQTPRLATSFRLPHPVSTAAFSSDGAHFAVATYDCAVRVYDARDLRSSRDSPAKTLTEGQGGAIHDIAFHPSNLILATATENHDIRLYDVSRSSTQRKAFKWLVDSYPVWSTAFHPSGQYLFAGTAHSALRIFDVQTLKCFSTTVASSSDETAGGVSNGISCVRSSPDGRVAVTASLDGNIRLFDVVSGQCVSTWRAAHNGHRITSLNVSKSGAYALSAGEDGTARLFELGGKGRTLKVYYGSASTCVRRPGPAASIVPGPRASFSHDEQHVIGTNKDGIPTAWDTVTGAIVAEFGSQGTVCTLAGPGDADVACWNQDGEVAFLS